MAEVTPLRRGAALRPRGRFLSVGIEMDVEGEDLVVRNADGSLERHSLRVSAGDEEEG